MKQTITTEIMTLQELKAVILKNKVDSNTVIQVDEGKISFVQNSKSVIEENQVSLHNCVFWFSGNFNDEKLGQALTVINILLDQ